ncbi:MAG: hypothetical protein KY476_03045 [Planctomycetes bacterium]|nr:hypothetical protein [Planctomycetota bacterium]
MNSPRQHRFSIGRPATFALCEADRRHLRVRDAARTARDDNPCPFGYVTRRIDPERRRCWQWVPQHYEPRYAYPLLVWLHDRGGDPAELLDVMPAISERNYLGLSLPVEDVLRAGSDAAVASLAFRLRRIVLRVRSQLRVHSERVIPLGFGAGGTLALQLLLHRPDWFGGAAALCGTRLADIRLRELRQLGRKRVLLAGTGSATQSPVEEAHRTARLLHAAGLEVTHRAYAAADVPTPRMLRDVDGWVMAGIAARK